MPTYKIQNNVWTLHGFHSIMFLNTEALPHMQLASSKPSRDNFRAQGHNKRDTLYTLYNQYISNKI